MPKLVKLQSYTVLCKNEFSDMSDLASADDLPPLQTDDEEEEEEQAKTKHKVSSVFQIYLRV